jgi:regulator of replication initiation timing
MSRYRTLVVGTAQSLRSARASELFAFLQANEVAFTQASDTPTKAGVETYDLVFFLSLDGKPARPLQQWVDLVKAKKLQGRFIVLYDVPLNEAWRTILDPEIEIGDDHALAESLEYLFEGKATEDLGALLDVPAPSEESSLFQEIDPSPAQQAVEFTHTSMEPSLDAPEASAASDEYDSLSLSLDATDASESFALSVAEETPFDLGLSSEAVDEAQADAYVADVSAEVDASQADFSGEEPVAYESSDELSEISAGLLSGEDDGSPVAHPDADISAPLAGRETFNAEIDVDEVLGVAAHAGTHVEPLSGGVFGVRSDDDAPLSSASSSPGDSSTLQKYAALKEREAREKEATIQVLKSQLSKLDAKLARSEAERRRLTLSTDEMKLQLSTLEENLSQKQFHIQKMESSHQEELRALSLRLDNAIFQASKAQNKLEEFRERVRTDFVKIRAQERELFNKLELQKRDAEALLASKDEQLLNQKREVDRFSYETEALRERLLEETEKAEERSSRLARAVQSLKLASDMLSGLTEEVLPTASDNFGDTKDSGEDAA